MGRRCPLGARAWLGRRHARCRQGSGAAASSVGARISHANLVGVSSGRHVQRFAPALVAGLDEPIRRYLTHAVAPGAVLTERVRVTMHGRIKVGRWMEFDAEQHFHGHEFEWRARAGWRRFKPMHVIDNYADGAGGTEGRLFGLMPFLHAVDANTARAAAARGAAESVWVPASLMPQREVSWHTRDENTIIASFEVPPERPELRLGIDERGALRSVSLDRWGNVGQREFSYIPFGGDILAEQRFGDYVVPSHMTVGWWYGTARYEPFFEAVVTRYELAP